MRLQEFVGVLECIEDTFEQEFDYVKEAACLRLAVNQFEPRFRSRGVSYPTPYDAVEFARPANAGLRAALPEALRGKGLVTRKVLVMRRCKGRTVSQVGQELLTAYAAKRGQVGTYLTRERERESNRVLTPDGSSIARAPLPQPSPFPSLPFPLPLSLPLPCPSQFRPSAPLRLPF